MKIKTIASVCLGLLVYTRADEALFREVEERSTGLQLQSLAASGSSCTSENVAVRREW